MTCLAIYEQCIAVTKGLYIDYYDRENHKIINITNKTLQKDDTICDIVFSADGKYLAALTSISKKLIIYKLPTLKEERIIALPRRASKVRFTVDNSKILLADKTGDCFIYNISSEDSGTKLLGHLSLLLNVLQSEDGKYIITADRDEKIRVTCYPHTYVIHTYCLGHKEFVNHIELLPHNLKYLLSTSGDGTIKCWNYENGTLCHSIETYIDINDKSLQDEYKKKMDEEGFQIECLPVTHFSTVKLNDTSSLIAVCVHSINKIFLYTIESDNEQIVHKLMNTLNINNLPNAIILHNSLLFVYFNNCEILEYKITINNLQLNVDFVNKISVFENIDVAPSALHDQNDIKFLYKRKFDNVQEYQERKKLRLGIT